MLLKDLLKHIGINHEGNEVINNLVEDSRVAKENDLFVAIKGENVDSHIFIDDVLKRGSFVVAQKGLYHKSSERVFFIDNSKRGLAVLSKYYFGCPDEKLFIVGITGTNGKTTTTYMIKSILDTYGVSTGIIGTIKYIIGDEEIKAKNTTPGPYQIYSILSKMVDKGLKACAMEISSHSLAMERVYSLDIDVAVFTNITQDHLDFHKTREEYFNSKVLIFDLLEKSKKSNKLAVYNADIPEADIIREYIKKFNFDVLTYGINKGDIRAKIRGLEINHNKFTICFDNKELLMDIPMLGRFNVYNTLASFASVKHKIDPEILPKALKAISVNGRFESITTSLGFVVIIDYAHTPDALKNVLETALEIKPVNIITVFGAGGDRDKTKRPLMGEVVSKLSNYSIITSDNPRSEEPLSIIKDIEKGMVNKNYSIEIDRETAIKKAIYMAEEGDLVLIAGKGHEDYQIIGDKTLYFSDKEVAIKYIKERENNARV